MIHEFENIVTAYQQNKLQGKASVLATVVALEGTSYRKPGVRMLINVDGKMIGAVSGGCVEKEIYRQSESVFKDGIPKIMTYDGRFRLGCEGILYILIEPIQLSEDFIQGFEKCLENREPLGLTSYFTKQDQQLDLSFGTRVEFANGISFPMNSGMNTPDALRLEALEVFHEDLPPALNLVIIGAEHDAVQLCSFAALSGWDVCVIATDSDPKEISNFPGAKTVINTRAELFEMDLIDDRTAVMLMTHSYSKDFKYLLRLEQGIVIPYIGLLGPAKRRERVLNEIMEHRPQVSEEFFDSIHGPAGINIGAETPQEIAISILSEMLSVFREQQIISLKDKKGRIHS
ncbi:XdhC family protein [Galbibacter sp.]|jgi:xanthine/CO dehydrogenase XdhC/CoxF family maturation factor|uniref:XdhC family protein n=1 Tax=Galbibacter sp. TaxID=2918471 RepID=UPI003A95D1B0